MFLVAWYGECDIKHEIFLYVINFHQLNFQRLLDTLQQSGDEQQRRVSDATRKITVLRVNEKALTRRYTASQEMEGTLRKV